jgi:uncharacterized protein YajQ (UPF0234 family)
MTRYIDRPYHNDVVKGGNTPPPVKDAALGGLEGIRRRLQVASSEDKKVAVLRDVLRYGQAGRDLLKQIVKSESGAVQVAAYCLLNFDSQATEIESQEILGVINAAVQRAIDTRIDVRQVSSPSLQEEANKSAVTAQTDLQRNLQKQDYPIVASNSGVNNKDTNTNNSGRIRASNNSNTSDRQPQKSQNPQLIKPAAKLSSDRTPQLPPIQPRSQVRIEANRGDRQPHQPNSANHKSKQTKPSKSDQKEGKKHQSGLKKWFNQTLGRSD